MGRGLAGLESLQPLVPVFRFRIHRSLPHQPVRFLRNKLFRNSSIIGQQPPRRYREGEEKAGTPLALGRPSSLSRASSSATTSLAMDAPAH
jgi:hypothetical protein